MENEPLLKAYSGSSPFSYLLYGFVLLKIILLNRYIGKDIARQRIFNKTGKAFSYTGALITCISGTIGPL